MRIFVYRQEAKTTCHNMGHQVAISELLSLDEKWRNAHLRIGSSVWKNPAQSRTTNEDVQKQPHKIPASCQFNLMNSSCSSSTSLPLDFCPQKIAFHGNLNRSNQFSQKLHAFIGHRNLHRSPVPGRLFVAGLDQHPSDRRGQRNLGGRREPRDLGPAAAPLARPADVAEELPWLGW